MSSKALLDTVVSAERSSSLAPATIVTIGNFDGVHRGHQRIIQAVNAAAERHNALSLALTFEPHPSTLLQDRPAKSFRLTTSSFREELLRCYGIDEVVTIPFSYDFADLRPVDFVQGLLNERLHAKEVHIGYDFAFGRGREGTTSKLQSLCAERGIEVIVHRAYQDTEETISSTRVRDHLKQHDLETVARLYGRPYSVPGVQQSGYQRGREMGIPTINFYPEDLLLPPHGVYVSRLKENNRRWDAVTSIGTRPTFDDDNRVSIETYVLDPTFPGTPYGASLQVELLQWIREERAFESAEALQEEMARDVEIARNYHSAHMRQAL